MPTRNSERTGPHPASNTLGNFRCANGLHFDFLARISQFSFCLIRVLLLENPFQCPLEALQCGRSLISPDRWLTAVAVARVHQDAHVLEFFLDQGEIMTEQSFLLGRERVLTCCGGHGDVFYMIWEWFTTMVRP
jgi:hypothetical protein